VMPVFSETDALRDTYQGLVAVLGDRLLETVIVMSPRSTEASQAICRQLAEQDPRIRLHVQQENPGVGRAFREGYALVRGNPVLSIDSDGEMDVATVPLMLAAMAKGNYGLVVGSRWAKGGGFVGYGPFKYWLNWGFQRLFRLLYWTKIHDLTYGFKLLRAEVVHGIIWESISEVGCETTLKPIWLGVPATEVPTVWRVRAQGESKNKSLNNFRYLKMALKIMVRGVPLVDSTPTGATKKTEGPAANSLS
jgi:dolichol-phosphate mannosyltransferase